MVVLAKAQVLSRTWKSMVGSKPWNPMMPIDIHPPGLGDTKVSYPQPVL